MDYVVNPTMSANKLTKKGLKVVYDDVTESILKKHNAEILDSDTKPPIGLIYDPNFKFQNKFRTSKIEKFKIMRDMVKKYELKKDQKVVMAAIVKEFNKIYTKDLPVYICLQANCGFGKTLLAINIILKCEYNRAFIVTHNKFSAFQFETKIHQFLPNVVTYVSSDGVSPLLKKIASGEFESPDVLIFPSRHLSEEPFLDYLQSNYSLGIVDEAHISNFSNDSTLRSFYTKRIFPVVLSMTATPRIDNSLYLGKLIRSKDYVEEKYPFERIAYNVVSDVTVEGFEFYTSYQNYKRATSKTKYVRKQLCLADDVNRRMLIVACVVHCMKSLNRRIVILTEYQEEAKAIYNLLVEKKFDVLMRIGTQEVNNTVKEFVKDKIKYIIIGTVDKLGTGFDLPSCNTVFVTSMYNTRTDIQQYAGRCIREYKLDNNTTRNFFYFAIRPHKSIKIYNQNNNMTLALKEVGWHVVTRSIYDTI